MANDLYCWRCQSVVPMLDEREWTLLEPALLKGIQDIQDYRVRDGCSFKEAMERAPDASALQVYESLTGLREANVNALWHHRIAMYGPPCPACSKPLRTQHASFCAACGEVRATDVPDAS